MLSMVHGKGVAMGSIQAGGNVQGRHFGLSIPKVHKAVHADCKSFENRHSSVWLYLFKCLRIAVR